MSEHEDIEEMTEEGSTLEVRRLNDKTLRPGAQILYSEPYTGCIVIAELPSYPSASCNIVQSEPGFGQVSAGCRCGVHGVSG